MAVTQKKGSFRRNVIGTFIAISILSLAITGAVSLVFVNLVGNFTTEESSQALEIQIQRNIEQTAEQNALVIRQKLASAEAMVSSLAEECESLFVDDSTYSPRELYYDYFFENQVAGLYPNDTHYDSAYEVDLSWTYSSWYIPESTSVNYDSFRVENQDKLDGVSNLDLVFQSVHERSDEFRWLYVAFENDLFINYPGSIVGDSDAVRNDPDQRWYPTQDDWYQTIGSGNGQMVYVDPYYDPIDQVLLLSVGRAVYYENETRIGVVSGDITVQEIRTKILDVQVLTSGYAALITADGGIVAHPDVDDVVYGLYDDVLPPLTDFEINTGGSAALTTAQLLQITSGDTGTVTYQKDAEDYLLAYAPVGVGGYICTIVVPLQEAKLAIEILEGRMDQVNAEGFFFIITVTVAGIVIAGIVAAAVTSQITKPLQYLMHLATRNVTAMITEKPLGSADLQVDPTYTSKDDEIGELARAFQGMLDSIKDEEQK